MANRQRTNGLYIMLTDEERELFEQKLKASRCKSMNHFIRKCVLEKEIFVLDLKPFYELQTELSRIGNNVNQIAKRVNATGIIYKTDVDEIKKDISKSSFDIVKILDKLQNIGK